jgi:5-methyltetrahydrofolate--homocysteine methyltransferase
MFLTIGERINATRKNIAQAVKDRDAEAIRAEADAQILGGALMLDINGGTTPETEKDALVWLADTIARHTNAPLCIDSANPEAVEAAIEAVLAARGAQPPARCEIAPGLPWLLINSTSAETGRYAAILPLVKKFNAAVVGLCMGDEAMPDTAQARADLAAQLVERLAADGVEPARVYIDPLILPAGVDQANGPAAIEAVAAIRAAHPGVRTVCGLTNISYGLPARALLNRTYLALLIAAGLDAAIVDTTNAKQNSVMLAALALTGRDPYCADFIGAFRKQLLDV